MSVISGFLNQTITSISKPSDDGYGDKTYTIVYYDVPCRWQEVKEQVILATGEVVTYTVKIFMFPEYNLLEGFKVIKDSKSYTIKKIDSKYDIEGNKDHLEVWCN